MSSPASQHPDFRVNGHVGPEASPFTVVPPDLPPAAAVAPDELGLFTPDGIDRVDPRMVHEPAGAASCRVSLVIPTKNEAGNIAYVLEQIPACVDEIILVDGHSCDATLVTARCCRSDVRIVEQPGTGKGDALRAGFEAATGDIIVMIDADGSMSPQEIPRLLFFLADGYDYVKGSRFMGGGASLDITRLRRMGNRTLLLMLNRMYSTHLTDLCYGFCAFHRRYLSFLDLSTPGFEIETQMTVCALRAGLRVAEVPSLEMPRRAGRSNLRTFRDGSRVLRTLLRSHDRGLSGFVVQSVVHAMHSPDDPLACPDPADGRLQG